MLLIKRHAQQKARPVPDPAPKASSIFSLHYKANISSRQLTYRIQKRGRLSELVELLGIRAYWKSLDGIAIAAVVTQMLRLARYDKQYNPQQAAQLLKQLEGPLAVTLRWNSIRTSSTIMWSLARLKSAANLELSTQELLARLLARATASSDKLKLIAPRRLSLIAWSTSRLVPRDALPAQLTALSDDDCMPPSPTQQADDTGATSSGLGAVGRFFALTSGASSTPSPSASTSETADSAGGTPRPQRPPPDLSRSARITLARVAAAACRRLPRLASPRRSTDTSPDPNVGPWEGCHFSPQGLANLSLGFAACNYYSSVLLQQLAVAVVAIADNSNAAPHCLSLQDCVGLAEAFAHWWPSQRHPEVFAAVARALPAALAAQRRLEATQAASTFPGSSSSSSSSQGGKLGLRSAKAMAQLQAAYAHVAAGVASLGATDDGASPSLRSSGMLSTSSTSPSAALVTPVQPVLSLQDCVALADAFSRLWPVAKHPEVFDVVMRAFPAAVVFSKRQHREAMETERQQRREQEHPLRLQRQQVQKQSVGSEDSTTQEVSTASDDGGNMVERKDGQQQRLQGARGEGSGGCQGVTRTLDDGRVMETSAVLLQASADMQAAFRRAERPYGRQAFSVE